MIKTKLKILECARELYNTKGVQQVSQRNITKEIGISPGNLTYHFKSKHDIEKKLYFELVKKLNRVVAQIDLEALDFQSITTYLSTLYDHMLAYRFVFTDMLYLMRKNPTIATHYRELLQIRKQQFEMMVKVLISKGIFRVPLFEDEYDLLYQRLQLITDFYFANAEIQSGVIQPDQKIHFINLLESMLAPFRKD
ncbi:MAG: TetR/AcrR family transcriptional regulator [Bacteroidota bacterium]